MIFISGGTGYLGSYVVARLLEQTTQNICLLVRSKTAADAKNKAWDALQLHLSQDAFEQFYRDRIETVLGDITQKDLGLSIEDLNLVQTKTTSIIHCAASLNRKSETKCAQVNLMGTLNMLNLAKQTKATRFSFVSTVAVAGHRKNEVVLEDASIDWMRKDYDPYARTKKFCEELVRSYYPDALIFRPSIVLGDSRFAQTTQFDMALAFVKLSKFFCIPFEKHWRLDIVPANYVGYAIADIHVKDQPKFKTYHLSSGKQSATYQDVANILKEKNLGRRPLFAPILLKPFSWTIDAMNWFPRSTGLYQMGALMKVFLPYLHFNTVFDNQRVTEELGHGPALFVEYCPGFYEFLEKNNFSYPYQPLKESA